MGHRTFLQEFFIPVDPRCYHAFLLIKHKTEIFAIDPSLGFGLLKFKWSKCGDIGHYFWAGDGHLKLFPGNLIAPGDNRSIGFCSETQIQKIFHASTRSNSRYGDVDHL